MVKLVKGNIFESDANLIAHGCNCVGGFGSGMAGQIAKRYPHVKENYLYQHRTRGWKLGEVQFVVIDGDGPLEVVANCATQQEYLPRTKVHADYDAIRTCMQRIKEFATTYMDNATIAVPKIGCGLAGGDWDVVYKILEEVFSDYDVSVYYLE